MADGPCVQLGGGGAWPWDPEARCDTGVTEESSEHSGDTGPVVYVGGSCSCQQGAAPLSWLSLALAMLLLIRRWGPLCALLWLAPVACAADAQLLRLSDGGPFTTLRADLGPAWGWSAVAGLNYAHQPVMAFVDGKREALLRGVTTAELAAGWNLGRRVRLGMDLPSHWFIQADPKDLQAPGDLSFSLAVSPTPEGAVGHSTWTVHAILPTGAEQLLLGGPGAALAVFTHQRPLGSLLGAASAGVRLQPLEELPGVILGPRLEARLGVATQKRWALALEGMGSMPLRSSHTELANVPLELLGSVRRALPGGSALRLGAGAGLGRGLGSPSFRLLATFEAQSSPVDTDGDGYVNARDLCDRQPEDRDKHADWDGCPDEDNDNDGFVDAEDACPDDPETPNGLLDDDGCPDRTSRLELKLTSTDPDFEGGEIQAAGQKLAVLAGERLEIELPPGVFLVQAVADGHRPKSVELDLSAGGRFEVVLPLEPITWGDLRVLLEDPQGAPLSGTATVGGEITAVPPEGATLTTWAGRASLTVASEGYGPRVLDVVVPRDGELLVRVQLEPLTLWADGGEVRLREEIRFSLDSAELHPDSALPLDALAAWLREHPEIELLRIEGHADEPGSPRYNHALSSRRAQSVLEALVARGVEQQRLEAIGSGEADIPAEGEGLRRVTFLVVIWDDSVLLPPPELAPLFSH